MTLQMRANSRTLLVYVTASIFFVFGICYMLIMGNLNNQTPGVVSLEQASGALPGYATVEGTLIYTQLTQEIPRDHFRLAAGNLLLSSIGIGSYLGDSTDDVDMELEVALTRSILGGLNHIDSAINYRGQRSERCIGRVLHKLIVETKKVQRNQLFISSKAGFIPTDAEKKINPASTLAQWKAIRSIPSDAHIEDDRHCIHPSCLLSSIDQSLANLNLETLDLLYLHNSVESQIEAIGKKAFFVDLKAAFVLLESLRTTIQPKIRFYGLATWRSFANTGAEPTHVELEEIVQLAVEAGGENHGFRFIQLPINMVLSKAFTSATQTVNGEKMTILDAAKKLGVFVVSSRSIDTSSDKISSVMKRQSCDAFKILGSNDTGARALQLTRSVPGLTTALVGMKSANHVDENLKLTRKSPFDETIFNLCH